MKLLTRVLLLGLTTCLIGGTRGAVGQYMFADVNGDGVSTDADRLSRTGKTAIDLWLVSDQNRDGTSTTVSSGGTPLTIFSYEFALRALGGTVKWDSYVNLQPSMIHSFGKADSPEEFYVGFGGKDVLPAGKLKLGTLTVQVVTGSPTLEFTAKSSIRPGGRTSFGSKYRGRDDDNTLKFVVGGSASRSTMGNVTGDWSDARGVGSPLHPGQQHAQGKADARSIAFGARAVRDAVTGQNRIVVVTTRSGHLRVRLFDLGGRLVRTIVDSDGVSPGTRSFGLDDGNRGSSTIARGVYLYRVEAAEGTQSGKIVHMR